jgi:hypothetical protein
VGAQHLRVPYGLIRQLCYAGGRRLAPQVSRVRPEEPEIDAEHIPYTYSAGSAPTTTSVQVINPTSLAIVGPRSHGQDLLGNLSNEAYKFFKGSMIRESNYFQCRGCLNIEYVKERKALHMRECRALMQAIEERIKRDKVCVICNTSTTRETWRIPLCSEACIVKWRFSIPLPWITASRFVLAAEPHLLRMKCENTPTNS